MLETPPPLNPEQVAQLHGWERFLGRFYTGSILAILAAMLLVFFLGESVVARRLALALGVGLLIAGTIIQRRVRCPSCARRLGFPSKLRFPDFCPSCRVHFPRPEGQ